MSLMLQPQCSYLLIWKKFYTEQEIDNFSINLLERQVNSDSDLPEWKISSHTLNRNFIYSFIWVTNKYAKYIAQVHSQYNNHSCRLKYQQTISLAYSELYLTTLCNIIYFWWMLLSNRFTNRGNCKSIRSAIVANEMFHDQEKASEKYQLV